MVKQYQIYPLSVIGSLCICLVLLLDLGFDCLAAAEPKAETNKSQYGFRIEAAASAQSVKPNEALDINIHLKYNGNKSRILVFSNNSLFDYNPEIRFNNDTAVALTAYGRRETQSESHTNRTVKVKSGDSIPFIFKHINRYYDMTLAGNYTITVSMKVPKGDNPADYTTVSASFNIEITN